MASKKTVKTQKTVTSEKTLSKRPGSFKKTEGSKKQVDRKPAELPSTKGPKPVLTKPKLTKETGKTSKTDKTKRSADVRTKKIPPSKGKKIQDIKKNLQMQRTMLFTEAEIALNILPGQTIFPDLGDQANAEIDRNFMLRLRGREQRLLKKIEAAIEKIDNGTFGICEACGQEIDIKRLEARPVTTMCIICKTEQEEDEKMKDRAGS